MSQRTLLLPISGMRYAGCEAVITKAVKTLPGVETVSADHRANKVKIRFDDALVSPSTILACIESKRDSYGVMDEKVSWLPRLKQIAVFWCCWL
jgi:copper chaperone CopZ